MALFFFNILVSAVIIAGASWLSRREPILAGFITALPLTSLLVLGLSYVQTGNGEQVSRYAVSIMAAIPASLLFFVPFLFYDRLKGSFWMYYLVGVGLLYVGFFVQRAIASRLLG